VNQIYDHIVGLRAIREYRDEPLRDEDLTAILEAARWTGSSKNSQRWGFVVVDDPEQRQRLADAGDFTGPVLAAPVTIALVQEPGGNRFDIGRAAQNIMLAAGAVGVASCAITLHREEMAAETLRLPEGAGCRYAVTLGYATETARPARFGGRKALQELVHHNRYGE
jgi:nitroreductase